LKGRDTYSYIQIGLLLRYLVNVNATNKIAGVLECINTLKSRLEEVDFKVSSSNFTTSFFGEVESKLLEIDQGGSLGSELAKKLSDEIFVLERHVLSEGVTKIVHVIPERRFNSDYLLNHQYKLLKPGDFEKLPELAQYDFKSSCRCLLFGESTAAAFHILRATEGTLKNYYFHHKKQNRLKKPMWGSILIELQKKTRNKPPQTLLNSLDLIRDSYRNPTQHPDATYDIDGAQDLFGLCIDVIGKMAKDL